MLTIWIVTTVMVALASAVSWAVTVSMGESGVIDVWAARMFFLSPLWPVVMVVLVALIARTAQQGVEN